MFYTIEELVQQADRDYQGNIADLMIATETELTGRERHEILALMTRNLEVMKESVQAGLSPEKSPTGLTGGDAAKLDAYIKKGKTLADSAVLGAARNAMAVNESNAKMGLVCATPTAGSAGCCSYNCYRKIGFERVATTGFSFHCRCIWACYR